MSDDLFVTPGLEGEMATPSTDDDVVEVVAGAGEVWLRSCGPVPKARAPAAIRPRCVRLMIRLRETLPATTSLDPTGEVQGQVDMAINLCNPNGDNALFEREFLRNIVRISSQAVDIVEKRYEPWPAKVEDFDDDPTVRASIARDFLAPERKKRDAAVSIGNDIKILVEDFTMIFTNKLHLC